MFDLEQLGDALEYVPTTNRPTRALQPKSLLKNNSVKSIENPSIPQPRPIQKPINPLDIFKETKKETLSFEQLLKQQNHTPEVKFEKPEPKIERKTDFFEMKEPQREVKKIAKANANDSYWNDDDNDAPVIQGRMKPPIIRRNDDNRSVASRRDENRSVASVADVKRNKDELVQPFNNISAPSPAINPAPSIPTINVLEQTRQIRREPINEIKQINYVADTSQLKKMLEQQLELQRQFNQKLLKEEQQAHKKEIDRLKLLHEQEMARKLELKTLQIEKLKEYFDLQLKVKSERNNELKQFSLANRKFQEGLKAFEKAEEELRNKGAKLEEDRQSRTSQNKMFQEFTHEKEKYLQEMISNLEIREKEFREEKQRHMSDLDRQKKKIGELQAKFYKKQRELEDKFSKKDRQLLEEYEQKQRKMNEQSSQLRLKTMEVEQNKLKHQQQKEELQIRQRKWQQSRVKLMQEIQTDKMKLISKEMELSSKYNEWQARECEMNLKQKEMSGKFKLIELQRKKYEVQRDMKKRTGGFQSKISFNRSKEQTGPTILQKSIKQLKDEYLRNLGHI